MTPSHESPTPRAEPPGDEPPPRPVAVRPVSKPRLTPGAGYWLRRQHEALSVVLVLIPDRSRPRGGL